MKQRYRAFRRKWGTYYLLDSTTGSRQNLKTKDRATALRLVHARNEAEANPRINLQIARAYLSTRMQRILIVDDDARMRQMLRQALASLASAFSEAGDGGEAIAACAAERPDWVLMDLRMKPIDGLRATAAIRARFPEKRVIIVTQYDEEGLRAEALRAGACAYVLKENLHELTGILTEDPAQEHCNQVNPRRPREPRFRMLSGLATILSAFPAATTVSRGAGPCAARGGARAIELRACALRMPRLGFAGMPAYLWMPFDD